MAIKLDNDGSYLNLNSEGFDQILNSSKMGQVLKSIGDKETAGLYPIYKGSKPTNASYEAGAIDSNHNVSRKIVSSEEVGLTRIPKRKVYQYKVELKENEYRKPIITGLKVWRFQK